MSDEPSNARKIGSSSLMSANTKDLSQKTNHSVQQAKTTVNQDALEFGESSDTYKILQDLGKRWESTSSQTERDRLHSVAEDVRRYARANTPIRNAHEEIIELLHNNAQEAINYQKQSEAGVGKYLYGLPSQNKFLDSATFLISAVDRGPWDYKRDPYWQVKYSVFDGADMSKHNSKNWKPWMYFDGRLISADKLGNMNMSYVGKKMGLPEWVYQNWTTTDKDDAQWVQYGIDLANQGR